MATRRGTVKKTELSAFANVRASGIIAVDLRVDDALVDVALTSGNDDVILISDAGYGKRTPLDQFPRKGRGGQGVIGQQLNDKTGRLIGAIVVDDSHEIMLISEAGILIRTRAAEVRVAGRNTQGVRIMRPTEGDRLVGVDRIEAEPVGEAANGNGNGGNGNEAAPA